MARKKPAAKEPEPLPDWQVEILAELEALPKLRLCLEESGKISMKLPVKGAKWHGAFKNLAEALTAADKVAPGRKTIIYVKPEEKGNV